MIAAAPTPVLAVPRTTTPLRRHPPIAVVVSYPALRSPPWTREYLLDVAAGAAADPAPLLTESDLVAAICRDYTELEADYRQAATGSMQELASMRALLNAALERELELQRQCVLLSEQNATTRNTLSKVYAQYAELSAAIADDSVVVEEPSL